MFSGGNWYDQLLQVALASARFGFAFALVPIFARETIPATVRNCIILTLGGVAFATHAQVVPTDFSAFGWARVLLKEAVVGTVIGFFFGTVMWAMEAAGEIIDAKIGATIGQLLDPLAGNFTSLNGALLGRLAGVIFVSVGGLTMLIGVIMESYAIWPMAEDWPSLDMGGLHYFEGEFGRLMMLAIMFAAPVLVLLYVIDSGLGILNRFAQQLNVFALSLSIKSWAATLLLLILLPVFVQAVIADLANRSDVARTIVRNLAQ